METVQIDYKNEVITIDGKQYPYAVCSNRMGDRICTRLYQGYELYSERKYLLFGEKIEKGINLIHGFDIYGLNLNDKTLYPEGVKETIKDEYDKWVKGGCRYYVNQSPIVCYSDEKERTEIIKKAFNNKPWQKRKDISKQETK